MMCSLAGRDLQHAHNLSRQQKVQLNESEAAVQLANRTRDELQQQVNLLESDASAIRYTQSI